MNNHDLKQKIIKKLMNRNIYIRKVSDVEYQTRCPYCGDSQKNFQTGHMYIRINVNDNLPIVYNCFKCPASGILKYQDLELLGIEDNEFKDGIQELNKNADKISAKSYEVEEKYFSYELPNPNDREKIRYLENRLGRQMNEKELKDIKVITSLKDFLLLNKINYVTCKGNFAKMLDRDYLGFLTNNNAYILFRQVRGNSDIRWYKYAITEESKGQRNMYSISTDIDIYTEDDIIINLSEGVFDCLSIAYNIEERKENVLNIAICGKYYVNIIKYLIGLGLIGDNIIVNIYSDNDHTEDTSIEYYRKVFKRFSYVFKEINIFYNMKSKDCGVPKSEIMLKRFKI